MALTVPLVGELILLEYVLGLSSVNTSMTASGTQGPVLHLYTQDVTIDNNLTIDELTECDAGGYAAVTMVSTGWGITQTNPVGTTTGFYSDVIFSLTDSSLVYGYYVTDTLGNLLWAERFSDGPYTIGSDGGDIKVTPKITLA